MFDESIDVGGIMRELKQGSSSSPAGGLAAGPVSSAVDVSRGLESRLAALAQYRSVIDEHRILGSEIPQFMRFRKIPRKVLRAAAQLIYRAAYLLTREQNEVNRYVLLSIDQLSEAVQLLKTASERDAARIAGMEDAIAVLARRISELEENAQENPEPGSESGHDAR